MANLFYPASLNVDIGGNLIVRGTKPVYSRSELEQDVNQEYVIPFTLMRVWDAYATLLPGTPATDDLGLVGGTFGSDVPSLETTNQASGGSTTMYARFSCELPPEYDNGQTVTLRARGGMIGAVADAEATVDFSAHKSDEFGLVDATDIVSTAPVTDNINSLTPADVDFNVTATSLSRGDVLDVRLKVVVNDAATGGTVKARIGKVSLLLDIKG